MSEFNLIKMDTKVLTKLIDVVSSGIGALYKPKAIRKICSTIKHPNLKIVYGNVLDKPDGSISLENIIEYK